MKILSLGDSYTIGEGVPYLQSFPHQIANSLAKKNHQVDALTILATTGFTTDELIGPMETQIKKYDYDWVTLLIGVNNQYRDRSVAEFDIHFQYLINRAIHFASGNPANVIVLSIPDWGLTPFNTERDKAAISSDIDAYNAVKKKYAQQLGAHYIDITESTRTNATDADFLAMDGLHPSGKEYAIWAEQCVSIICNQ
jgi:lysophospholipase L1-like esterase